jgi:hypothetical protein
MSETYVNINDRQQEFLQQFPGEGSNILVETDEGVGVGFHGLVNVKRQAD